LPKSFEFFIKNLAQFPFKRIKINVKILPDDKSFKMAEKTLLEKLEGLQNKFDEISTLITDPDVISDQKRFAKLNKEYHDLREILNVKNEY